MPEEVKYRNNYILNVGKDGELSLSSFSLGNYGDSQITALTFNTLDLDWYNSNINNYQQLISFLDTSKEQDENNPLVYEMSGDSFLIPEELTKLSSNLQVLYILKEIEDDSVEGNLDNPSKSLTHIILMKKNPFSYTRYKEIPEDTDYLTIWFGWNDTAYGTLGTIDDSTNETYYGAYKIVLDYLIKNLSNTKIGIIVPYGTSTEMREAVRILAKRYGVGCLDLTGDVNIPCIYNKESSFNMPLDIQQTWQDKYLHNRGAHMNLVGNLALSYAYEEWLRKL